MNITICFDKFDPVPWLNDLRLALPESKVSIWKPGAPQSDIALVWEPSQQFIDEQQNLKILFNIGAGVDTLLRLKIPSNMKIIRTDDTSISMQMVEYVSYAVLKYFRKLDFYENDTKKKRWSIRKPRDKSEFPIGIMGAGLLGEQVAKALKIFEFNINTYSRTPKHIEGIQNFSGTESLEHFLRASRVLINLLPLTHDTENILNKNTLSKLQTGSYLINVGRGNHLVEEDLIELLDSGHMAGATLDVFRTEPLPSEHPFWNHPDITITPHISGRITREQIISQIVNKIKMSNVGMPITGSVDILRGY